MYIELTVKKLKKYFIKSFINDIICHIIDDRCVYVYDICGYIYLALFGEALLEHSLRTPVAAQHKVQGVKK